MRSSFYYSSIKTLFILSLFYTDYLIAQDYYPLQIGNRWDYEIFSTGLKVSTFGSIEVLSDSLFPNGKTYYVLSDYDLSGGRYVRADNDYIYYYDENNSEEDTLYHLNVEVGDSWELFWGPFQFISVFYIHTTELFDSTSTIISFRLDGLILNYVDFSDLFGPSHFLFPGEPPGTSSTIKNLIGGIIGGEEFGDPLTVDQSSDNNLTAYSLSQNYPNPFNPETKIEFSIPERDFVSVRIYDVLGNEVAALVNEEKPAGEYQVSFDAKGLSSGIYFYQLKSKYSILSKKMILIK